MIFSADQQQLPLVSVIVRTVDRPFYLKECLTSILAQDYPNIEVLIINDGGPSIRQLVKECALPFPYQVIELKENRGRSECSNIGLDNATGQYICFIDDDDIFYPFHITTAVNALLESGRKVVYTDALQARQIKCPFNEKIYSTIELSLVLSEEYDFQDLLERNYIPILCAMFHRDCIDDGERFDTSMDVLEDWDFWIRLGRKEKFFHIKKITCEYRYREDGSNTVGQLSHIWAWCTKRIADKYGMLKMPKLRQVELAGEA